MTTERLALERAPLRAMALDRSVRRIDQDGHLYVETCVLSAADVGAYNGSEINDWQGLGLDPRRVYNLYRDPESLAAAAASFAGKPVLFVHKPVSSDDHPHEIVVGAVGSDIRFEAPSLIGPFTVWDGEAIAAIDSGEMRCVSAAYHWAAVMEPGTVNGTSYDGRMIVKAFNHLAIVDEPRVKTAIIGDAAIKFLPKPAFNQEITMARNATVSRQALLASGALRTYLRSKLAQDAKLDLTPVLKGVTHKNWVASKPKIKLALDRAVSGKLAQDADIEDVIELLDQLDDVAEAIPETAVVTAPAGDPAEDEADDTEMVAKLKAALKALGKSDEEIEKICGGTASPATPALDEKNEDDDKVSKPAMDAAIAAARREAEGAAVARINALHDAKRAVEPVVGDVLGMDSAGDVYAFALKQEGYDLTGIDASAFRPMFDQHVKHKNAAEPKSRIAMDYQRTATLKDRYPSIARIRLGG